MKNKRKIFRLLQFVLLFVILYFVISLLYRNPKQVKETFEVIQWEWIIAVIGLLCINNILKASLWAYLIRKIGGRLGFFHLIAIWHCALMGIYIPGSIWMMVGILYQLRKAGVPDKISSISLVLEQIMTLGAGLFIVFMSPDILQYLHIPRAVGYILAPAVLFIFNLHLFGKILWKMGIKRFDLQNLPKIPLVVLINYFIGLIVTFYINGLMILAMLALFQARHDLNILGSTSIGTASFVSGYLSILTPNGIGVKDGIFAFLLSKHIVLTTAIIVAFSGRLWPFVASIIGYSMGYFYLKTLPPSDNA